MLLALAVTFLMRVLNLRSEVRVRVRPRYLPETVLWRGWSCSLYDLLIIVLLLPAIMVKHLSALNCISQVISQEQTESRSDWRSPASDGAVNNTVISK